MIAELVLHILHVIDSLDVGGAEKSLVEISTGVRAAGCRVSVCATRRLGPMANRLPPDVHTQCLARRSRWDWRSLTRFAEVVNRQAPDVLHVHGRSSLRFVAAARRFVGCRTPVLAHDHWGGGRSGAWPARWTHHRSQRYVVCSAGQRESVHRAGVPADAVDLIPGALDLTRDVSRAADLRRLFDVPDHTLLGVTVGGIRPDKGLDVLLTALAGCRLKRPIRLLVVGAGRDARYLERCERMAAQFELSSQVTFAGERQQIVAELARADFAVHPSRVESGPLALIEYFAAGLPVVCTRAGGLAQQASSAGLERFVPAADPDALRHGIEEIAELTDQPLRDRGSRGRDFARANFDIRRRIPAWLSAYEKTCAC